MPADKIQGKSPKNFIRHIIEHDLKQNKCGGRVRLRFPPEPNGYLHIGHAKAICLNFGLAEEFKGRCNLRFDDTNPEKEKPEYMKAIENDVCWLGGRWEKICHSSDYFEQLYEYAVRLIRSGKAFVCSLTPEQIRKHRGTLTEAGLNSPDRDRDREENESLFARMRSGRFEEGRYTLRAKIDMASPNLNMRDPVIYRINKKPHSRIGARWCIYPTYDFAQCLSDSIEGVTHSLCTLEFEDHRPLYDWILEQLDVHRPRQIEFARLELSHTVTSKRNLKRLLDAKVVQSWDDPRMPTIAGMRRRGIPAAVIRDFCARIGITKKNSVVDLALLESCLRDYLNERAWRAFAVLQPLKLIIENYPDHQQEMVHAPLHPKRSIGTRALPFSKALYIDRDDLMENPSPQFQRLAPGRMVRLKYAYCVKCHDLKKNNHGEIIEVHCRYDPDSRSGGDKKNKKLRAIHWLSAEHAQAAKIYLYDRLFVHENPMRADDLLQTINPESLQVLSNCRIEPDLKPAELAYQFERLGYFYKAEERNGTPCFNRVIGLRDTWAREKATKSD